MGDSGTLWCSEEQLEANRGKRATAASFQEEEQNGLNRLEGENLPLEKLFCRDGDLSAAAYCRGNYGGLNQLCSWWIILYLQNYAWLPTAELPLAHKD